jgi:hypothetical protein
VSFGTLALILILAALGRLFGAAFALLQRRVGEDSQPTRRPLRRRIKA